MNKLTLSNTKTLKLTNVLRYKILLDDENFDFNITVQQMQSYIKSKGAMQIGPLIQYSNAVVNDNGELDVTIEILLQCNNYINNVEQPYKMESVIRVTDCMYCRYNGPEDKLKFAYDKINLEAFENDIKLKGDSYTVFVADDMESETIIADVFMEKENK